MSCVRHSASVGAAIVLALSTLAAVPATPGARLAADRVDRLERWLAAVREHQPGRRDDAAERIGAWKNADVDALRPVLETFFNLMREPSAPDPGSRQDLDNGLVERIRALARAERARADANVIVKRGAMLHADIMMSGAARLERYRNARAASRAAASGEIAVLGTDGQHEGYAAIPAHWPFARWLLVWVHPDPAADGYVRLWYRATASYMLQRNQWGDVDRHLRDARARLTPDAGVHLDSGSLFEAYASPRAQAMVADARRHGTRLDVMEPAANLRIAEVHYSQALVLDPALVEARVRLARVRIALGRPREAVADLERASIMATDPVVRYLAVLFLGDAHDALGAADASRAAYGRAAALYPPSQAPHLALSLLAREAGDREAAQAALRGLHDLTSPDGTRYEPWWLYYMGSGRNMRRLVLTLWNETPGADAP
jgi:hypothetical protein